MRKNLRYTCLNLIDNSLEEYINLVISKEPIIQQELLYINRLNLVFISKPKCIFKRNSIVLTHHR